MKLTVKLRLSRLTPDKGVLYLRLTHRRQSAWLSTSLPLFAKEWNDRKQAILIPHDSTPLRCQELHAEKKKLEGQLKAIQDIIKSKEALGTYSAHDIIEHYRNRGHRSSLSACMLRRIDLLKAAGRFGTAHAARNALSCFIRYRRGRDLPLGQLDAIEVQSFERYLRAQSYSMNTVSTYLRALRSMYNEAVREKIVDAKVANPFSGTFTGNAPTRKIATDSQTISRIASLRLQQEDRRLSLSQDMFLFSFYCRGMSYVDMIHLRVQDMQGKRLVYKRQKTGQEIEVKLTPEARTIIHRYKRRLRGNAYLFPVLSDKATDPERWRQYESGLGRYNRHLKSLSKRIKAPQALTGYVSRHSWATIARNEGIPLETISRSLGHESEQTTRIYIGRLDSHPVDKANELVIKRVLYSWGEKGERIRRKKTKSFVAKALRGDPG